jgi:hypothetical protein
MWLVIQFLAATQTVFPFVETAEVSSGMPLPVFASTAFSNVKGIIVGIPDEVIFIVFRNDTMIQWLDVHSEDPFGRYYVGECGR